MRVVKLAIISFFVLFLLLTAISFFIPPQVRVLRALQMNAPIEKIMAQVSDPSKWNEWFPGMDTTSVYLENGQPTGRYISEKQERFVRINSKDSTHVIAEYRGVRQKKVITGWLLQTESTGKVTVTWYMDISLRWYPWEKFSSILFEKQYGPQLEQGLEKLKKQVENN